MDSETEAMVGTFAILLVRTNGKIIRAIEFDVYDD